MFKTIFLIFNMSLKVPMFTFEFKTVLKCLFFIFSNLQSCFFIYFRLILIGHQAIMYTLVAVSLCDEELKFFILFIYLSDHLKTPRWSRISGGLVCNQMFLSNPNQSKAKSMLPLSHWKTSFWGKMLFAVSLRLTGCHSFYSPNVLIAVQPLLRAN